MVADDSLTMVVWILRMVLPCILFWISFGPKVRIPWYPRNHVHARQTLLEHRQVVAAAGGPAPEVLSNLTLVNEETAPFLFADRRGAGAARNERERDRPKEQRRERKRQPASPLIEVQEETEVEQVASEELMHLESLVNFVAFNRREQKRVFLPECNRQPPPPPRPTKQADPQRSVSSPSEAASVTSAAKERANTEAQMVLRGALRVAPRGATVAQGLYAQLTDLSVEISSSTFELMVEACIEANDLHTASEFLRRMETSGHSPGNDLLDRVMELYLLHKRTQDPKHKSEPTPQPPPPPPPPPQATPSWPTTVEMTSDISIGQLCQAPESNGYAAVEHYDHVNGCGGIAPSMHWDTDAPRRHNPTEGLRWCPPAVPCPIEKKPAQALPAFSVPDEFATKQADTEDSAASANNDGSDLSKFGLLKKHIDDTEDLPVTSNSIRQQHNSFEVMDGQRPNSKTLSPDAAVFVPGETPGFDNSCSRSQYLQSQEVGGLLVNGHSGEQPPRGTMCTSASLTAATHDGDINDGVQFAFSPEASIFKPGTVVPPENDQAWEVQRGNNDLRATALPFVPHDTMTTASYS